MYNYQPDSENQPVIVEALRTPIGRAYGSLAGIDGVHLLVPLMKRLLANPCLKGENIDEVIVGNATGGGGNIARLALLAAGLPIAVPGVSVDRQCGSGLESIIHAARLIQSQAGECYIAGGVESISTAPWRVEKPASLKQMPRFYARARFSPDEIGDPDMGIAAENVAVRWGISRERQDRFALRSHELAVAAIEAGYFADEIIPLSTAAGWIDQDECPRTTTSLKVLAGLTPAFVENGTVTTGNCCPLNDGAALVLIMSRKKARQLGYQHGLIFLDAASRGVDPNYLGTGPVASTRKLMSRQPKLSLPDISVIEFNEAFASQVLASLDCLGIDAGRVNKQGGAIALGHPYGASGAILVTRIYTQLIRGTLRGEALALAMLGIAGGLGLTALFQATDAI